jgi:UDP-glucose 4-epimerase
MLFNILEYCRRHAIPGLLFSSGREVYGNSDHAVHGETDASVQDCESPYAASKIGGEALVHAYHQCYGIDFIITRFSNVYGMYDTSDRVIPLFIRLTRDNRDLVVYGKDKLLDFSSIDDTVAGIIRCIERFPAVKNNVFNIASGRSVPVLDVAYLIRSSMGKKNKIVIGETRTGEVVRSVLDITKAKKHLGYEPQVKIEEGIKRSVGWYHELYAGHPLV